MSLTWEREGDWWVERRMVMGCKREGEKETGSKEVIARGGGKGKGKGDMNAVP